jgi:aspartyl-tRNA(Asn)/glutamyl-tRNA(Gln) amidotransferase subunit A
MGREIFSSCDLLLMPSSPTPAPEIAEVRYGAARRTGAMTLPFNMTGHPALSICCGMTPQMLPLGLQIIARPFEEATLLGAAMTYQAASGMHRSPAMVSQ